MKTNIFALILLFCVCNYNSSAQNKCIADAGPDIKNCRQDFTPDDLYIGGNPTATGKPPFSYKWESTYQSSQGTLTASDFLNDTTIANPKVVRVEEFPQVFFLTVTDADGKTCKDTMSLKSSFAIYQPISNPYEINPGDSVLLDRGKNIFTNFLWASFVWRPNHGLTDSTNLIFYAKPTVTTNYYLVVTDEIGCTLKSPVFYTITVKTVGVTDIEKENSSVSVFPNPATEFININVADKSAQDLKFEFFDVEGKLLYQTETKSKSFQLKTDLFSKGGVLYKITSAQKTVSQGKFIVE